MVNLFLHTMVKAEKECRNDAERDVSVWYCDAHLHDSL